MEEHYFSLLQGSFACLLNKFNKVFFKNWNLQRHAYRLSELMTKSHKHNDLFVGSSEQADYFHVEHANNITYMNFHFNGVFTFHSYVNSLSIDNHHS